MIGRVDEPRLEHRFTRTRPRLHYVVAGSGEPVLLLHGFPDFWRGWRHQITGLVDAGYRVIVPDQRGYNLSDRPRGVSAYVIDSLAADVLRLSEEVAGDRPLRVVGHDWGGIVAWWLALHYPTRLEALAVLNAPHPTAFQKHLLTHPTQMLRSLYALFFQIPGLPERFLARDGHAPLRRALLASARPGSFSDEEMPLYQAAWGQSGALTSMINWYRAAAPHPPRPANSPRVAARTLILWGEDDVAIEKQLAFASHALCDQGRLVLFPSASHWVQRDEPAKVTESLIAFLGEGRQTAGRR